MATWSARSPTPALPVIVVGAAGHACVLIDALRLMGARVLGCSSNEAVRPSGLPQDVDFLGDEEAILDRTPASVYLVNGLGSIASTGRRRALYERFKSEGYRFAQVVHPAAVIASEVDLGEGAQVMAGAVVQTGCRVGHNVLVGSGCTIDHDCIIDDHAHIAAGATLAGSVTVDSGAHVGTGATVIQGLSIGAGSLIAAGATVIEPVADHVAVAGSPAHVIPS